MYVLHQGTDLIGASEEILDINAMLDNPLSKDKLAEATAYGVEVLLAEVITAAEVQGFTVSSLTSLSSEDKSGRNKLLKDATRADIEQWHKDNDQIAIIWSVEDVEVQADEDGYDITREEAMDLLMGIDRNHDACYGVTWDTISNKIQLYGTERTEDEEDTNDF